MLPYDSVQQMCMTSDLIVAGEKVDDTKVRVTEVFYGPDGTPKEEDTIEVLSIPDHTRLLGGTSNGTSHPKIEIETNRVFLFMLRSKEGQFAPIHFRGPGSQGLFWWDEKNCYGYEQKMNPGPYMLFSSGKGHGRIPVGPEAMRKQIAEGLEQRHRWEGIKALKDPRERAQQMAAYLLPRTAPKGYDRSLNLRQEISIMGADAVPAVTEVLEKAQPDDRLNDAVLILYDIGCDKAAGPEVIRPAVPALCKLLKNLGKTSLYYLLCPLTVAGDPRAIPHVRPMLKSEDRQVRAQAARALAAMKDVESFGVIAGLFDNPPDPKDQTGYTLEIAKSLFELDPKRARPIIQRIEAAPGNEGLHNFIQGYSLPDARRGG